MEVGGRMDGWMGGWVDGWSGVLWRGKALGKGEIVQDTNDNLNVHNLRRALDTRAQERVDKADDRMRTSAQSLPVLSRRCAAPCRKRRVTGMHL